MSKLDDVLKDCAPVAVATKTASISLPAKGASLQELMHKVAETLRTVPEPVVTMESLYAVKEAGFRDSCPSQPELRAPEATGAGAPLRKLAHVVRTFEQERLVRFHEKNAQTLRALRGLTLLRERVMT